MIKPSNTAKLVAALVLFLGCGADAARAQEAPDVAARAWALADIRSGEVVVRVDEDRVGESPLVARRGYEEASLWERVWYTVVGIFV